MKINTYEEKDDFEEKYIKEVDKTNLYELNTIPLGFLIENAFNTFSEHSNYHLKDKNITRKQLYILFVLNMYKNIPQEKIASILNLKEVTVTREINHLEKNQFIVRKNDVTDKRKKLVNITYKGKDFLEKLDINKLEKDIGNYLTSEEIHILRILLKKLIMSTKNIKLE